jgi:hypothetical protein
MRNTPWLIFGFLQVCAGRGARALGGGSKGGRGLALGQATQKASILIERDNRYLTLLSNRETASP